MPFDPLDPYGLKRSFARANELRALVRATADPAFLLRARRALLPLPLLDRPPRVENPLPPTPRRNPARALEGKRVAVIGTGGSGACVSMVGVARAFEEAGVRPASITACSGSAIWGAMWAAGMSAHEMADFSLAWRPEDYLDIQWRRLPRFALSALRGFTGIAKGEAVEHLLDERLRSLPVGETPIPITTIVFNMDLGQVRYFGSRRTPDLTLGKLVRIAIALPLFIEAVSVDDHLYVDGGIIDLFPTEPVLEEGDDIDHVFGLNFMLPSQFEPRDVTGWERHALGVLEASRQLEQGYHLEFARRAQRQLGDRLTIIDPVDHRELRGVSFYDLFIDRASWPRLIRQGYESATLALDAFRSRPAKSLRARAN
ncbi:MAG: patatin-like phospholipase family protein [Solirubrobacteraceae bacterium]|nr:patatin-like phospholipase family protein [Solirubrobacteraceae bacterium]